MIDLLQHAARPDGDLVVLFFQGKGEVDLEDRLGEIDLIVTGPHATQEVMDAVHLHVPKPHDPFVAPQKYFDLYPEGSLTLRRPTESVTENDVLRELLGLSPAPRNASRASSAIAPLIAPGTRPCVARGRH